MAKKKTMTPRVRSVARLASAVTIDTPKKKAPAKPRAAAVERRARAAAAKNGAMARQLVKEILRRARRIEADFHAIGVALRRLSEPKLYEALGYDNFEALLKGEKLPSKTVAYKLMAVADAYPAGTARRLGLDKAYGLVRYAEATPAADVARVLAASNPRIGEQRLSAMSVRDLADATRRARSAAGSPKPIDESEREARKVARALQKSLRAKGASSAEVRARRSRGTWRIVVDLSVAEVEVVG